MSWKRMWFKDAKVYVRVDDDGEPVVRDGRVDICYRPDDRKVYKAGANKIRAIDENDEQSPGERAAVVQPPSRPRSRPTPEQPPQGGLIEIWTDGACSGNPGEAGLGVVLVAGAHRREISRYLGRATNNIAELSAIREALLQIRSPLRPIRLYSDSAYAIGVLDKGWRAKKNTELVEEIREMLARFPYLELVKVPGHAGVPENERADELAVKAVTDKTDWEGRS